MNQGNVQTDVRDGGETDRKRVSTPMDLDPHPMMWSLTRKEPQQEGKKASPLKPRGRAWSPRTRWPWNGEAMGLFPPC